MDSTAPAAAAPTPPLDLTQALPFPVVLVDDRGVVLQTNPAFDQAFGPRAPGVDRLPSAVLDADTLAQLPSLVRSDEGVRLCSLGADEQPVYEVVARRVTEGAVLLCLRDATASRAADRGRTRRRRLSALGAVAATLADDLLDPLTLMRVGSEQMADELDRVRRAWAEMRPICRAASPVQEETFAEADGALAALRELLQAAEAGLGRMARLVELLPTFVHAAEIAAPVEPVPLHDALDDALMLTRGALRARCELRVMRGAPCTVRAARVDLQQVLVDLLVRVSEAFAGWGVLEIESAPVADRATVRLRARDAHPPAALHRRLAATDLSDIVDTVRHDGGDVEIEPSADALIVTLWLPRETHAPDA